MAPLPPSKPVLIANLHEPDSPYDPNILQQMHPNLLQLLENDASLTVQEAKSIQEYENQLASLKPEVVLFVTNVVATDTRVRGTLLPFLQNGGMAILFSLVPSSVSPDELDLLFQHLGLTWKCGEYVRTNQILTEIGNSLLTGVDNTYSAKALHLSDVPPNQSLYAPEPNATSASLVPSMAGQPVDPNSTLAALARIGNGALVYVGDVNAEEGTDRLIHALCKLNL